MLTEECSKATYIEAPSVMRRVLRRARDGATLNVDEATTLLQARGDDLADLCCSSHHG
ncbi:hypothetical protein O4328_34660 [Rhodococcus opacus]|uniref:Uncharacterized protein n=1 Tax=Rhodococcus opacus TaxID=37919 RepID=A0AAX3YRS3_RHOOP|nr:MULTISPECIES: hypothetical protein [Rhodococcus]MCZ4588734.1 hypothetical protein [Rhodococcus opacus]QSE86564.1 hypothetical protein JWS14_43440 [Rhodococcus koreensis]WLF51776.1 hypothetical protein Q5707_40570 [Rhodococcus opacus]WLF52427.1 hypothetical protein Q5707_44425 [Rhodococcus opacus]